MESRYCIKIEEIKIVSEVLVKKEIPLRVALLNKMIVLFHMMCLACQQSDVQDAYIQKLLATFDDATLCERGRVEFARQM